MEIEAEKERQRAKEQTKALRKAALEKRQLAKQVESLEELRRRGFMEKSLAEQKEEAARNKAELQALRSRLGEKEEENKHLREGTLVLDNQLVQQKRTWEEQRNKLVEELANEVNSTNVEAEKYEAEKA